MPRTEGSTLDENRSPKVERADHPENPATSRASFESHDFQSTLAKALERTIKHFTRLIANPTTALQATRAYTPAPATKHATISKTVATFCTRLQRFNPTNRSFEPKMPSNVIRGREITP